MMTGGDTKASNVSWLSYHAKNQNDEKEVDISVLFSLFSKGSKSAVMIRHAEVVVKKAANHVNPNQTPVIALDQPMYAITKQMQWNWSKIYGEEKFGIMMGALNIEMAALKTLGMCSYFKGTRYWHDKTSQ